MPKKGQEQFGQEADKEIETAAETAAENPDLEARARLEALRPRINALRNTARTAITIGLKLPVPPNTDPEIAKLEKETADHLFATDPEALAIDPSLSAKIISILVPDDNKPKN